MKKTLIKAAEQYASGKMTNEEARAYEEVLSKSTSPFFRKTTYISDKLNKTQNDINERTNSKETKTDYTSMRGLLGDYDNKRPEEELFGNLRKRKNES